MFELEKEYKTFSFQEFTGIFFHTKLEGLFYIPDSTKKAAAPVVPAVQPMHFASYVLPSRVFRTTPRMLFNTTPKRTATSIPLRTPFITPSTFSFSNFEPMTDILSITTPAVNKRSGFKFVQDFSQNFPLVRSVRNRRSEIKTYTRETSENKKLFGLITTKFQHPKSHVLKEDQCISSKPVGN